MSGFMSRAHAERIGFDELTMTRLIGTPARLDWVDDALIGEHSFGRVATSRVVSFAAPK